MEDWSILACDCSKIVSDDIPTCPSRECKCSACKVTNRIKSKKPWLKVVILTVFISCLFTLSFFELRDCTTIQTIYANDLPDSKIVQKPEYVILPKVDMKCYRAKYSYLILYYLFTSYSLFLFACLALVSKYF
ncbi:unnamed protein product [Rhizopus stolonifer]